MGAFCGFFRPRSSVELFLYEELDWKELEEEYAMLCCQHHAEIQTLSDESKQPDWADLLAKQWLETIRQIYEEKEMPKEGFSTEIVKSTGKELARAVDKGYSIIKGIEYEEIDHIARDILKRNVWKFSVAKNHNDLIRLNNLLINKDGSIRAWNDFKREALFVVGTSNRYLKTEYDTIIAGAMMSRKWQDIQRDKYIFPFVQFKVVQDSRTSDICSPLHNVICKVDDPFLAHYFPPNHFNCRTDVIRLRDGEPTPQKALPYLDIPKAFLNNTGATGEIFTADNSYIKNTPKSILDEGEKLYLKETLKVQRTEIREWAKQNLIGKVIYHYDLLEGIHFSNKGINEALNQPHKHIIEKNEVVRNIVSVIENSLYKGYTFYKGRKSHIFEIFINNEKSYIIANEHQGKGIIFYSISDSDKVLKDIKKD